MVIVWYHPLDYWGYKARLQRTCLQIIEQYENEGIEFAFPSRTIYIASQNASPGRVAHMEHTLGHLKGEKIND